MRIDELPVGAEFRFDSSSDNYMCRSCVHVVIGPTVLHGTAFIVAKCVRPCSTEGGYHYSSGRQQEYYCHRGVELVAQPVPDLFEEGL